MEDVQQLAAELFQSTPPARGATGAARPAKPQLLYFNPRPPRGGRPRRAYRQCTPPRFQSTPPARGATAARRREAGRAVISIHAPREGGDMSPSSIMYNMLISIHAPREGGDPLLLGAFDSYRHFNPRPPRGGRRRRLWRRHGSGAISIHAPREGGDHSLSS